MQSMNHARLFGHICVSGNRRHVMTKSIIAVCFTLALAPIPLFAAEPFQLPVSARVLETAADGKGWAAGGEIAVSFEQAQRQFAIKIASAGWHHIHTIDLGRDRVLEAWDRGGDELTLMLWRISPGRSGFSYGVSHKAGGKGDR